MITLVGLLARPALKRAFSTTRPLDYLPNVINNTGKARRTHDVHFRPFRERSFHTKSPKQMEKVWLNTASIAVLMFAASFAAVPLYKIYCQSTGKGGQAFKDEENKIVGMKPDKSRSITVRFNTAPHSSTPWNFEPLQDKIVVHPGETALAFYRATNPFDELVIGVATYTVMPYEAGVYFNKIQCFCFEEQMLQPKEDVFMPVLFYIDPEFSKDPQLGNTKEIVLSYTFFRSKDGELI